MLSSPSIEGSTVVGLNEDQLSCNLDGETVLMSIQSGMYFGLDSIGTRIWDLLQEPKAVTHLCELLTQEYEVQPAQCEQEVISFLHTLAEKDLIKVS
jgi:hypothetical protein